MFNRRETNWIGFQEAQKTISNLKQEVELTEKKLLHVKRAFFEKTDRKKSPKSQLLFEKPLSIPQHTETKQARQSPHFIKETLSVPTKILSRNNGSTNSIVTKEVLITSEEEPNLIPPKYPDIEPLDLNYTLIKSSCDSFLSKLSSSGDIFSDNEVRHSSSEGTSSLIASTYRDADKLLKKNEIRTTGITSDISFASVQDNAYKEKKIHFISKSNLKKSDDIGMEWKEVPGNKSFALQKFKQDDIQKLKDIIDKQKKKQEQYQLHLETDFSSSYEHLDLRKTQTIEEPQPLNTVVDDQILPLPIRKVCRVKSLPTYKGFSAPHKTVSTGTRWRKQKNKYTIAKSANSKNDNVIGPKRIKTVVKCESDFISASNWRNKETKEVNGKEKYSSEISDSDSSKTSPVETLENEKLENDINTDIKIDIQSMLKEDQQLNDVNSVNSEEDAKSETYSIEKLDSHLSKIDNDQNSLKENKRPVKLKAVKKKAKKPSEKKILSPKIKPYDVDKVRDYMKKKKEERRKRHQEEHRKQMQEAQQRKKSLEKLFEYQKQNKKNVTKVKPSSPVKVRREYEDQHANSSTKNEHVLKDSSVHKAINTEQKDLSSCHEKSSKRKLQEESEGREVSEKNQVNTNKSHKRKQENMHIDVSVPKLISVSITPTSKHTKIVKDSTQATPSKEIDIKSSENKTTMKVMSNKSVKPSNEGNLEDKIGKQSLQQQNVEIIDFEDSKTYKVTDAFRSISTVSTPNTSHINGASEDLMTGIKTTKFSLPEMKSKEAETLKDLIKHINMMTKPLEPFLRTRKWIEDNPLPPPSIMKKKIPNNSELIHEQQLELTVRDADSHVENSKSGNSKESSFKEQVSGIGDVSQLYAQLLGRKSTFEPTQNIKNRSAFVGEKFHHSKNEMSDEVIEGSLLSADEYVLDESQNFKTGSRSRMSSNSSHFSDLQKANVIPDPFNLINTMKRKPLGLAIQAEKVNASRNLPRPSKRSKNNVPFEEIYKSLLSTISTDSQAEITDSKITRVSQGSLLSQGLKRSASTYLSVQHSSFENDISSETLSKISETASLTNHSFEDISKSSSSKSIQSQKQMEQPFSENHSLSNVESSESVASVIASNSIKNSADFPVQNDTISEHLQESNPELHASGTSEMILSGTINSEYTLEIGAEESDKEVIEEINSKEKVFRKESLTDKVSGSGSSVSEVISVVEISKGLKSSAEDLQTDKIVKSPKHLDAHTHSFGDDKSNSDDKTSLKSTSNKSSHQQSSEKHEEKSISTSSAVDTQKNSEYSALLLKHDQLQSVPSGSQNSVTIDFRQPLRLTLSNGESVQSNQGLELHDNQYLHTQVVTRVASEAAAAAATSAVIAVFETQKALLAEKNYMGLINSYGRSSSSKKTQYSSDFESSQAGKSSIHSPESSAAESKHSKPIQEDISGDSNNELSSKNESIEEKVISEYSDPDQNLQLKSAQYTSTNTEKSAASVHSQEILSSNQKTPQRTKRKISSNISSPSPASLSDNESVSSETLMSSHSNFSHLSDALSDDSFAQLTLDVVRRMTHEEELRAKHQLSLLQFQEKTLVEKARAEMMWLELLKKRLREKGEERKVSSVKKRQKELILRLRQERAQLQCMQEAYRSICEKHHSLLEDKKKLLKEPNLLALQLLKDEKPHTSKYNEGRIKEFPKQKSSSSTPSVVSDNDLKTMVDEESVSEVPEILKGLASNSSQESVVETQASEPIKTSNSSQNKSQRSSPNPPFSPLNAVQGNSNPSLHSNNSLESALQGLKKLEASKRHLTKREQRILQRRKQVESLLQWQMKLDSEEMAVRELEQKALDLVDHSKKRTKYYISSSGSTNQDDDKRKESVYESLPSVNEVSSQTSKLSKNSSVQLTNENTNKLSQIASDDSIPTNLSGNGLEERSEKDNVQISSATPSSGSLPEEIKSASGESSIKTVDATESVSQVEEVRSEISYHISPSAKDKSSSSEIYSESFESNGSKKTLSVLSNSSPFKHSSPSRSIKKDSGIGIRLPLVPRNVRRHDSSGSDDSYTISQSETASDQSDIEVRIHALAEELKRRKAEAEKLKREQKKKYREQLKEKELSLQKQLEAYNQYIHQAKLDLEHQIESATSTQTSEALVKPRIKWPRPEQVIDSRRVRKQAPVSPESFIAEKKSEQISISPENTECSTVTSKEKAKVVRKLFPDLVSKTEEESCSIEISEKSTADSKEVSEVLSAVNSSEIQEISEIEQSKSISSEVSSDIKEVSETNEYSTNSSAKLQKLEEIKSSVCDQKQSSSASPIDEKSSHDTVESKSQTDTFITESSSSKSSELNSPQQSDDSSVSNRTVSSDDEQSTRIIKNSGDNTQKSSTQHSHDILHESASSEESISEIQSVINSVSPDEEFSNGNSSKNCKSSDGCETHPKNEITDLERKHLQLGVDIISEEKHMVTLVGVQSAANAEPPNNKKLYPSESQVVNIVNYLSSSLIDDTFQIFYKISKEKCVLKSLLNKTHEKRVPLDSQNMKKNVAEMLSLSLYDTYLKDTFDSFFRIIKELKNGVQSAATLSSSYNVSTTQDIVSTTSSNISNTNSFSKIEDREFPINYMIQDINENQIFSKSDNWSTDNFVGSQREQQIQELEQQLVLQQYSYFYRKIPNKPPPPYTPPSSTTSSFEFPFTKDKPKEKVATVKEVKRHIDDVVDSALEILLDGKQKGLPLSEISLPSENSIADKLELTAPHQTVFIDLVFDLMKEVILEKYSETKEIPQPWLRPRKLTPKSLIPSSKDVMSSCIQSEIKKALKINVSPSSTNQRKQIMWSSLKLGRKKRDFVDTILISELKEEEPDWVNYDQDEVTVKLQIADSIFNVLLNDTVNVIKQLELKINR